MRQIILLTAILLTLTSSLKAQDSHWTLDANQWQSETVIYCDLVTGDNDTDFENYEIAAFVDGELRAIGTLNPDLNDDIFVFRVKGDDSDAGKTITFKAYNSETGVETDIVLKETPLPVTYNGETLDPGTPSSPRHLYLSEATAVDLAKIITLNKGESIDLTDYLTISPEGATIPNNLTWDTANSSEYFTVEGNTLTALKSSTDTHPLILNVGNLSSVAMVKITNNPTAINIVEGSTSVTVEKGDQQYLTAFLSKAYILVPEDADGTVTWAISDPTIVQDMAPTASGYNPIAAGTTTLTAQVLDSDGVIIVQSGQVVTVTVVEALTGFTVIANELMAYGLPSSVTVSPVPAGSAYDASQLSIIFSSDDMSDYTQTITEGTEADGSVEYTVTPTLPGPYTITVMYNGQAAGTQSGNTGMPLELTEGWQWRTLPYGTVMPEELREALGGDNLVEVRSQDELLYNDSQYGYYGDIAINGLYQDTFYKIKSNAATETPYIVTEGWLKSEDVNALIYNGWTWLGNPYLRSHSLDDVLTFAQSGDRIVSKASGFAEYDGTSWVGTLASLDPGQGYLYYSDREEDIVTMPSEFSLPLSDSNNSTPYSGNAKASTMFADNSTVVLPASWTFNESLYRDNMSVIATLSEFTLSSGQTVGAFVGDECRGIGKTINGQIFLTVHGQVGERVSFYIYDTTTGQQTVCEQSIVLQPAVGTLSAPAKLSAGSFATAIDNTGITTVQDDEPTAAYTVAGVSTATDSRGVSIIRTAKGKVKKVMR